MDKSKLCHCGQPIHYACKAVQRLVEKMILEQGEFIDVVAAPSGKRYKVPRHYIALHGLNFTNLDELGFEVVSK